MPRYYRVPATFSPDATDTNFDLVSLLPADDKPIELVGWVIGQSTEVGDTQEEGLRLVLKHLGATASAGSGAPGAAVTPVPNKPGDTAAGFTARCGDDTPATSSGTTTTLEELGWNVRSTPWERWIPEELRPRASQTEGLALTCETTLGDAVTLEVVFFVAEYGG